MISKKPANAVSSEYNGDIVRLPYYFTTYTTVHALEGFLNFPDDGNIELVLDHNLY